MKLFTDNRKIIDQWNNNIVDTKKALVLGEKKFMMELTIHGSIMIPFPIVTHHQSFRRKINRKKSEIHIGAVQNFSRFNRFKKHFRINLAMTNNMSTYEK
jgi:hypothetical protein